MTTNLNMDNLMDGLFGGKSSFSVSEDSSGQIVQLPLSEIYDKPNHTFRRMPDSQWPDYVESIRSYGILSPVLVRSKESDAGKYECIAGHNRRAAAAEIGLETVPAIISESTDDDTADILMVVTNIQRETWTPMETAHSWRVLYCALKHQGQRQDLKTGPSAEEQLEALSGKDIRTVQRTIKLCDLNEALQMMVDAKKLSATTAYHLAFLSEENQSVVEQLIMSCSMPSATDAEYFKKLQDQGFTFTLPALTAYMATRSEKTERFRLTEKEMKGWFPATYTGTNAEKKALIQQLLQNYFETAEATEESYG